MTDTIVGSFLNEINRQNVFEALALLKRNDRASLILFVAHDLAQDLEKQNRQHKADMYRRKATSDKPKAQMLVGQNILHLVLHLR